MRTKKKELNVVETGDSLYHVKSRLQYLSERVEYFLEILMAGVKLRNIISMFRANA